MFGLYSAESEATLLPVTGKINGLINAFSCGLIKRKHSSYLYDSGWKIQSPMLVSGMETAKCQRISKRNLGKILKRKTFSIIVFLWFVSTLAFTCLGYGSDNDAWLVAENARIIARIGEYTRSRTVGFPLFELAVTPLVNRGQWYLSNMLPLSFGFLIFAALYRLLNINEFRYPFVTIVTLMYLPIIIKNASSTMDYIPSLALLMWAYVFLRESKWIPAGLMIGVATGFRPTSILFAIPAVVYSFTETKRIRQASNLLLVSVLSGAFTFSPVLLKYGFNVSPLSTHLKGKMLLFITGYHALRLFGIPQTIVIGVALIAITYRVMHQEKMNPYFLFHFSNLFIWSLLFLRFPYEPEYMLPLVPSVIFLLDRYLSKNGTILIGKRDESYT